MATTFIIKGIIANADGTSASNAHTVEIHQYNSTGNNFVKKAPSGDAPSIVDGYYEIQVEDSNLESNEAGGYDIVVKVFNSGSLVQTSPLIKNINLVQRVNLALGESFKGIRNYDFAINRVDSVSNDLITNDGNNSIDFSRTAEIAKKKGLSVREVANIARAKKIKSTLDIDGQVSLDQPAVFALLKGNLGQDIPKLLTTEVNLLKSELRKAAEDNVLNITGEVESTISTIVNDIKAASAKKIVETIDHEMGSFLSQGTLEMSQQEQEDFVKTLLTQTTDNPDDFWTNLESTSVGSTKANELKERAQFTAMAGNTNVANALYHALNGENGFNALYEKSVEDITTIIESQAEFFPGNINENGTGNLATSYATSILQKLELSEPTKFFLGRDRISDESLSPNLAILSDEYPEFDLVNSNVRTYDFSEGSLDGADLVDLEDIQKLAKVAPNIGRYDVVKRLWSDGFRSAGDIAAKSRLNFVNTYKDELGEAEATETYINAQNRASMAMTISARFNPHLRGLSIPSFDLPSFGSGDSTNGLPNLENLFGALSVCSCKHCQSVLSPAAYMVDLFQWLKEVTVAGGGTLYSLLNTKRPDLKHILLSCENTNTVLPHIDLAIEILELEAAKLGGHTIASSEYKRQTTLETPVLKAMPEYFKTDAYEVLNSHVYPWQGIYNFWESAAPVYLEHLGNSYYGLLTNLPYHNGGNITKIPDEVRASKFVQLSPLEYVILTGTDTEVSLKMTNGNDNNAYNGFTPFNGESNTALDDDIPLLLNTTGLSFEELKTLVNTYFIQEGGSLAVTYASNGCDLEGISLPSLSVSHLRRFFRFFILQKSLKWDISATDIVIKAFNTLTNGKISNDAIIEIGGFKGLIAHTNLSIAEQASWFAPLSTYSYNGNTDFFHSVFANPALKNLQEELGGTSIEGWFELNPDGSELLQSSTNYAQIPELLNHILSVSRLSKSDYDAIMSHYVPGGEAQEMNLAHISFLYRIGSFVREMNIPVSDFLLIADKLDYTPLSIAYLNTDDGHVDNRAKVEDTLLFKATLDLLDNFNLSGKELDFLFTDNEPDEFTIPEQSVYDMFDALEEEFNSDDFAKRIEGTSGSDAETELKKLVLFERLAEFFETESSIIAAVLESQDSTIDIVIPSSGGLILDWFLSSNFQNGTATQAEGLEGLQYLNRVLLLISKLDIKAEDIPYLKFDTTDILALHLLGNSYSSSSFTAFVQLLKATKLNKRFRADNQSLFSVLYENRDESVSNVIEAVTILTAWEELTWIAGATGFGFAESSSDFDLGNDYQTKTEWLLLANEAIAMAGRAGVSVQELTTWVTNEMDQAHLDKIIGAAKSKYGEEKWNQIAAPLRDTLRVKQRDSLAHYVAHHSSEIPTNDLYGLYEHFLIDSEINPCYLTSRIKQANSTIQLFVQRALMNLEKNGSTPVEIPKNFKKEWQWRKNYRVWEANRKVFLYPENWMEPELRDDQTLFFIEMIEELQENDIDTESANRAFLNYVEKVNQVSELEIAQMCYDEIEEQNGLPKIPDLHVFGRTKSIPHDYYHRRWVNNQYWTEWVKVDLEIEGEYLMPIIYNGRLMLFWPSLLQKKAYPEKIAVDTIPYLKDLDENNEQRQVDLVEIHLNWSEYYNGKWTKLQRAKETILDYHHVFVGFFSASVSDANILEVYVFQDSWDVEGKINEPRTWLRRDGLALGSRHKWVFDGCNNSPRVVSDWPDNNDDNNTYRWSNTVYTGVQFQKWFLEKNSGPLAVSVGLGSSLFEHHTDIYRYFGNVSLQNRPYELTSNHVELFSQISDRRYYLTFAHQTETKSGFFDRGKNHFFFEDGHNTFFIKPVRKVRNLQQESILTLKDFSRKALRDLQINPVHDSVPVLQQSGALGLSDSLADSSTFFTPSQSQLVVENTLSGRSVWSQEVEPPSVAQGFSPPILSYEYRFYPFYHKYLCLFKKQINRYGADGLLDPEAGRSPQDDLLQLQQVTELFFKNKYSPTSNVIGHSDAGEKRLPKYDIDFTQGSGYGIYNWEIFFHAPLYIASELSKNQKFADAQKWFHYIFDPTETNGNAPERFWRVKPFHDLTATGAVSQIDDLLSEDNEELKSAISVWRQNPFMPYAVGRMRTESFMLDTVMKYLDNLIAWGDHLFSRDTMESLNEATQVYALAGQVLGKKPLEISKDDFQTSSYNDLGSFNFFSNAAREIEAVLAVRPTSYDGSFLDQEMPKVDLSNNYFCLPNNEMLWKYWEIVADRLFKIRNCQNIEGVFRQLPLFEPPIDPALLVRAAASGISIADALNQLNAPSPHYRYTFLYQKAMELINDAKSLGSMLLSALEKRDAEELSQLRAKHEVSVMERLVDIKKTALEEAKSNIDSLESSRAIAEHRKNYYSSREYLNGREAAQFKLMTQAQILDGIGFGIRTVGGIITPAVPAVTVVASLPPAVDTKVVDGLTLGGAMTIAADVLQFTANLTRNQANVSGMLGGYDRRQDDWNFQAQAADLEILQIEKQKIAAEIRVAMAEKEVEHQQSQKDESQQAKDFLEDKFTNKKLYGWMVKEVSKLYFDAYKMAFDMAKKAEKAHFREVEIENSQSVQYINFGHWDSLRKGLLAGERLHEDLKRLDIAHTEKNQRDFELTKQVSLRVIEPQALLNLQEKGFCDFDIPEIWYDLDHPGHYRRMIKSVSLTIPCVTGPYTSISSTLRLQKSGIRVDKTSLSPYHYTDYTTDPRFVSGFSGKDSIATSTAQNDSGVFELNFNDPRYLPFEGAGAVSNWRLELPHNIDLSDGSELTGTEAFNQFDYGSISDVILTIRYTAREDGTVKQAALESTSSRINFALDQTAATGDGLWRLVSLKREFPTAYHRFLTESDLDNLHQVDIELDQKHFPHIFKDKALETNEAVIVIVPRKGLVSGLPANIQESSQETINLRHNGTLFNGGTSPDYSPVPSDNVWGNAASITQKKGQLVNPIATWTLSLDEDKVGSMQINGTDVVNANGGLEKDLIEDIIIAIRYKKS